MNALLGAATFLPPILIGVLVVHLLWRELFPTSLVMKLFLGIGIGLGLNSLLYFLYLLAFAGKHFFIIAELAILVLLLLAAVRRWRPRTNMLPAGPWLDYWKIGLLVAALAVAALAADGALVVWGHRPSGTWDAFMIYNRTARFVYRSQADWLQSFSTQLDAVFHADYPLLIPLSITSGWDALNRKSPYIPLFFSALFILGSAGLLASALALVKSSWQAAAGLIILLNTPLFLVTGASQTGDVPLGFFILATAVLLFLYAARQEPGLLALAGLTSGLAAWTKNEGQLFAAAASVCVVFVIARPRRWRDLNAYLAGLLPPLAIVAYFKFFLAPPNDLLAAGIVQSLQSMLQLSRHLIILGQYARSLSHSANPGSGLVWSLSHTRGSSASPPQEPRGAPTGCYCSWSFCNWADTTSSI